MKFFDNLDPIAEYFTWNKQYSNYYRGDQNRIALMHNFPSGTQGQKYWYSYDALGSVLGITKHSGQSNHNYRYSDFGTVVPANGNFTQPHNRFTYTGIEVDNHSGLYEFYSRAYDPSIGIWLQQDDYRGELPNPMSLHRYMYVNNSPINYWDAYGYEAMTDEELALSLQGRMITMNEDDIYETFNSEYVSLDSVGTNMNLSRLSDAKLEELEKVYEQKINETKEQMEGGYEAQMAGTAVLALGVSQTDSPVVPIMDVVAVTGFCVVAVYTYANQAAIEVSLDLLLKQQTDTLKTIRDMQASRESSGVGTIDPKNPYRNQNKSQLEKSRRSMEQNIEEHKDKIANPDKYIKPGEIKGDPIKYREGLIEKWQKDIEVFEKEILKIDEVLNSM